MISRRALLKLLQESKDPVVLAVAAHDVGQYVKFYDRGKKWVFRISLLPMNCVERLIDLHTRLINDFGGKTRVMELMTHENADVRYRALVSVQRLVSSPWASV